jgi:hypothetical protein
MLSVVAEEAALRTDESSAGNRLYLFGSRVKPFAPHALFLQAI